MNQFAHEPLEENSLDVELEAERQRINQTELLQLAHTDEDTDPVIQRSVSSRSSSITFNWKKDLKNYGTSVGRMRFDAHIGVLDKIKTSDLQALRGCIVDNIMLISACTDKQLSEHQLLEGPTESGEDNPNDTSCPKSLRKSLDDLSGSITMLDASLAVALSSFTTEEKNGTLKCISKRIDILSGIAKTINGIIGSREQA